MHPMRETHTNKHTNATLTKTDNRYTIISVQIVLDLSLQNTLDFALQIYSTNRKKSISNSTFC